MSFLTSSSSFALSLLSILAKMPCSNINKKVVAAWKITNEECAITHLLITNELGVQDLRYLSSMYFTK